jgi:hypothetical protein
MWESVAAFLTRLLSSQCTCRERLSVSFWVCLILGLA